MSGQLQYYSALMQCSVLSCLQLPSLAQRGAYNAAKIVIVAFFSACINAVSAVGQHSTGLHARRARTACATTLLTAARLAPPLRGLPAWSGGRGSRTCAHDGRLVQSQPTQRATGRVLGQPSGLAAQTRAAAPGERRQAPQWRQAHRFENEG